MAELLEGEPDDVLVYADGVATTRRELQAIADRIGAEDLSGQAIGVLMPNAPAAIAAWFGI